MPEDNNCPPTENIFRRMLKSEVIVAVSIFTAAFSVFGVYKELSDRTSSLEYKIDYIEKNHLTHIETDIEQIRQSLEEEKGKSSDRAIKIERILTLLEEHEKSTRDLLEGN